MAQAFQNLFGYLLAQYLIGERHADRAYTRLWGLITMVGLLVATVIVGMWAINAYTEMPRLNLFVFFSGTPVILFLALAPRVQAIGLIIGILGSKLGGATLSDSVKKGVEDWYKVIRATLLWFWVVSGFLSTMPFSNSPSAFWVIAAMLLALMLVIEHYNLGGKWVPKVLIVYTLGVTALSFVELVPQKPATEAPGKAAETTRPAPASKSIVREARWESAAEGDAIPTNVWSHWSEIEPGCGVKFAFSKAHFRVEYRYLGNKAHEYVDGTSPNMSSIRYMVIADGVSKVPFTTTC